MSIQIKSLKKGTLPTSEGDLYVVPSSKTAIVKSIRLVNTGSASATVNLFVKRSTTGTSYRIVPKDLVLAPNAAFVDSDEITLEGLTGTNAEDRVTGLVASGTVDVVISGVERDA
jgi:hypothetical protein